MPEQMTLLDVPGRPAVRKSKLLFNPKEFKVLALRECPTPAEQQLIDTPQAAANYFRDQVTQHPYFNPDTECFVTLLLNTRRRIMGHVLISTGTLDTLLVHPREVFRPAIIAAAAAVVLAHSHPSGEATPSEADIKVTRDLIRAGQLIKIDVLDHIVIGRRDCPTPGHPGFVSLRELGYFFS